VEFPKIELPVIVIPAWPPTIPLLEFSEIALSMTFSAPSVETPEPPFPNTKTPTSLSVPEVGLKTPSSLLPVIANPLISMSPSVATLNTRDD